MILRRLFAHKKLLLTGAGKDRVGIVKDITGLIFDEEGNIADSRMSKLRQNFALMILVELPEENIGSFKQKIKASRETYGIHLEATDVYEENEKNGETQDQKIMIELVGDDQPGIVYNLTQHLAGKNANIDKIDTFSYIAPMGGITLFRVKTLVTLNKSVGFDEFKEGLKALEGPLLVSIKVYLAQDGSESSSDS